MEFRVLGPLEVGQRGKALPLGGAKQRAVLGLLIIHAPEPVSTERLLDALWGDRPPSTAQHAVQVYISAIRKLLRDAEDSVGQEARDGRARTGGQPATLTRGSVGYRLVIEPEQVDACRFDRLVEEGLRALRTGALEDADRILGEAVALWRGPALADFLFMDFARTEASRLEELRVAAVEARLEARLRLGDCAGVISELQALVADHPLREHARWLLMRALYRAERQAEALAVYRAGHQILNEELGLEPGKELRELEQAILRQVDLPHGDSPSRPDPGVPPSRLPELQLPPGLRVAPPVDYVGRAQEQELVRKCWSAARDGLRHALLISGEPGIGKSQFAFRTAREFHSSGAVVLLGHCPEELAAPYGAWIQALSPFVEQADDELLAAYVVRHGGELARIVPALGRRVPLDTTPRQTDPESERYLLFSSVLGLLEQASAVAPVVLVIDDLHWADRTSLAMLKHVVAESEDLRLLVLATYRDSDLSRDHPLTPLLADLRREQRIERLQLGGLESDQVLSLLRATAGAERTETAGRLAREITAETGGNPFFVCEMLRHLSEAGVLADSTDGARGSVGHLGLPQSVREVVARRVERLGEECREVLSCASVMGLRFDFEVLVRIVRVDEDRLVDLLDAAVEASLLQELPGPAGLFSFAHDLINQALYMDLGPTRRARVHRRIAEALEDLCGEDVASRIEELARHWMAASPSDPERARAYAQRAGEHALAQLAPDEAAGWFAQAHALLDKGAPVGQSERCELTIRLGEAQRQAGNPEFRVTLLSAARLAEEMGDASRMARAALANSRGFASAFGAVDLERLALLERAADLNRVTDRATRARLLSLQAMELQFDPDYRRRRALADEALTLARESGDEQILPYVLHDHFHATWAVDTLEDRRRTAEEMTDLAADAEDPLVRIWALDRSVHIAVESGELAEALETLALLRSLTDHLGQPGLRWHATYYAAGLAHLRGQLEESERLAEAGARLGEQGAEPDTIFISFAQLAMVRVEQGRGAEVVHVLAQAAANYPGVPAYEAGHAAVLCDLGRMPDAARLLDRRADRDFADIPLDQVYSTALALWAKVAADVGSDRAAAPLYALIEPWRDQFVWSGAMGYGSAQHYLGMLAATLGASDRANEHFAAASAAHRREGVKVWEARNLFYWARALLASGAAKDGVATAERAQAIAHQNGYTAIAARAHKLLEMAAVA